MYPMALMMSGVWCCGLLCLGSRSVGIMVECCVIILSFCSPSRVSSRACSVVLSRDDIISICVWDLKSLMVWFPKSILSIDHLPPSCFFSWSWSSLNMMLCLNVRSLALDLYPPKRCVLVSGWLHMVHIFGPCELYFFLHLYTCDPYATSFALRLDLYGDCEYTCMLNSVPVSLAY